MRIEVELLNGEKVFIGGRPLMSESKLNEAFPELKVAIDDHDEVLADMQDEPADSPRQERLGGKFQDAMTKLAYQIALIFNPCIDRFTFLIDHSIYIEIMGIWRGNANAKKK